MMRGVRGWRMREMKSRESRRDAEEGKERGNEQTNERVKKVWLPTGGTFSLKPVPRSIYGWRLKEGANRCTEGNVDH